MLNDPVYTALCPQEGFTCSDDTSDGSRFLIVRHHRVVGIPTDLFCKVSKHFTFPFDMSNPS